MDAINKKVLPPWVVEHYDTIDIDQLSAPSFSPGPHETVRGTASDHLKRLWTLRILANHIRKSTDEIEKMLHFTLIGNILSELIDFALREECGGLWQYQRIELRKNFQIVTSPEPDVTS